VRRTSACASRAGPPSEYCHAGRIARCARTEADRPRHTSNPCGGQCFCWLDRKAASEAWTSVGDDETGPRLTPPGSNYPLDAPPLSSTMGLVCSDHVQSSPGGVALQRLDVPATAARSHEAPRPEGPSSLHHCLGRIHRPSLFGRPGSELYYW